MAFFKSMTLLSALLVLLPMATYAIDWPDISPSIADEICKQVECGKGTCSFNTSEPLAYTCECDKGWKRTAEGNDDLKFLPCVIPECTLDYDGCQAPPKVHDYTEVPRNLSAFDPCYWIYCGEGTCVKNSTYLYTPECQCKSGASNLLDVSVFPCYSECDPTVGSKVMSSFMKHIRNLPCITSAGTLQPDCAALGIKVADATSTSPDGTTTDSSKTSDFMPGKFQLMTIAMVAIGMIL